MPYISVHVDLKDVLDDVSDEELEKELARRRKSGVGTNYSIPRREAKYTLEQAADILRGSGRLDLAFKLEEIRTDFIN